tara:strand:- start:748 stop:963 length:216 start_codon:yes stop_codon:yes gene_type:complete
MKHNEKVKLYSAYMNGCAIAFFAVGCLGVAGSMLLSLEPMTFEKGLAYVVFFGGSVAWHLVGRRALNGLQE